MSKITRKTAVIFGGNAPAAATGIAQFGSLAASTPAFSTDPAIIQALPQWLSGWNSALEAGASPALEDMNAVNYVNSYQLAYLLQQGVAEWDSGTTYYTNSIVQSSGSLYKSLTDTNLNNPVTDTNSWAPIQANPPKGENMFRNAGMQVEQRGNTGSIGAGTSGYTLDGWIVGCTGAGSIAWSHQFDGALTGSASAIDLTCIGGMTDTYIEQKIEDIIVQGLGSQNAYVTFQCAITNLLTDVSVNVIPKLTVKSLTSGTVVVNNVTLQTCNFGTVTTVSYTFQLPTDYYYGLDVKLDIGDALNHSSSMGVRFSLFDLSVTPTFLFTGINHAPPIPQIRPIGVELPFCQRYYQAYNGGGISNIIPVGTGWMVGGTGGSVAEFGIIFPAMRANPTLTMTPTGFSIQGFDGNTYVLTGSTITGYLAAAGLGLVKITGASGLATNVGGQLVFNNASTASYSLSAEL